MSREPGRCDPGAEDPRWELAHELRRTLLVVSRVLRRRTASQDVSAPEVSVLAFLDREGDAAPGRLADFERVSPPVMTRMLARLEKRGLVRRRPHPQDGRQVLVSLTPEGASLVVSARRERDRWLRERLEDVDDEELAVLERAARILRERLVESPATERPAPAWSTDPRGS